jgi:xylan 1,4-beta-xylosidase
MKRHYRENLTLTTLAEHQNLSVSYLSKFFEKHMGSNFVQYYTSLRLERAVNEILTSDNTIENISQNSGFSDSRSLVKAFKKNYGMLPSSYRKSFAKNNTKASAPLLIPAKWTSIQLNDTGKLEQLRKYLNLFPSELPVSKHNLKYIDCETIDYRSGISVLHHNYRSMITVSSAKLLLHSSVRDMIRDAQQEIGFQYISFHGLLSDDMMVYNESLDGNPSISFTYINEVLDFVTSLHLKPFIRLNFMPSSLASSTDKCIYFRKDIISKPKEIGKWQLLVEKLFKNLIHRYGVKEVSSWPVNIWNEPATSIFGFDDETDFFQFYVTTFRMIKNILPSAKIGTPPITFLDDSWFIRFHQFLLKNQCYPDYIDLHYYDDAAATSKKIDESTDKSFFFQNLSHFGIIDSLNTDPDSFFLYLNDFKKTMKNIGYSKIPHYLSEWNLTLSSRNRINDTCFKACYLAKNLLENYDRLDSFGYWSITDHHEEQQIPSSLYHGGFGLLTMNGIPKASYNVLRLMKRLGNTFLGRGSGWFATKEDYKVMVLYYNYEHYPKLFSSGKLFDMTNIENFVPFSNKQDCVAKVHFTNLPAKNCKVKEYFVNRNHGSSFDTWIRMGGESLNQEDLEFLRNTSSEGLYVHKEEIIGGHLTISSILEPLEIRLVEIELMDYM